MSDSHSESRSGFRKFWNKSRRGSEQSKGDVANQGSIKKPGNGVSRVFKGKDSPSGSSDAPSEDQTKDGDKRRKQVYQAQKRHRNRRAEYVKNLEAEVAKLQQQDAAASHEKNTLAYQNQIMRELLASNSLEFRLDTMDLSPMPTVEDQRTLFNMAAVEVRVDPVIGHERTFLDLDFSNLDNMDTTPTASSHTEASQRIDTPSSAQGDTWAAVDFILSLEWCCQGHMPHPGIYPGGASMCSDEDEGHGHALTTTAHVYGSALSPVETEDQSSSVAQNKWHLPHSEIDKLVQMSSNLPLDDDFVTPAQAYSAVKAAVPGDEHLRPALEALKGPLSGLVSCQGFGAVMPTDKFQLHLDATMAAIHTGSGLPDASDSR